jgi:hypothetical protein
VKKKLGKEKSILRLPQEEESLNKYSIIIRGSSNGRTVAFEAINSWFEPKPPSHAQRGFTPMSGEPFDGLDDLFSIIFVSVVARSYLANFFSIGVEINPVIQFTGLRNRLRKPINVWLSITHSCNFIIN